MLEPLSGARGQATKQKPVQPAQRESEPTLRVDTQLVNVFFTVTDKQNRYLNDLMKGEITVLENGKPQEIFTFKRENDLPLTMAILVDVSRSVLPVLPQLIEAGAHFINSVMRLEKDTAAVVEFEGDTTLIRDLTSNVNRLRGGLREIAQTHPLPRRGYGGVPPVIYGSQRGGTSIYDSVIAVSEDLLAKEAGRKTIILFTDGIDTTSWMKRNDAIEAALRAEVVVYAIGIGDPAEDGVDKGELNKLCEPTGGRAFIPRDVEDLDQAFAQLEQSLRQQYLLAYEPTNDATDGTFRKIEVRLNKRKDVRVRHRRGYYAPKAE